MTSEEQVLMDALAANGFLNLDWWGLQCLDSALASSNIVGRNMKRLVNDLNAGEAGVRVQAEQLFKQAQCTHQQRMFRGRIQVCRDCGAQRRPLDSHWVDADGQYLNDQAEKRRAERQERST